MNQMNTVVRVSAHGDEAKSPIQSRLDDLTGTLHCAQEGANLLRMKLEPIIGPQPCSVGGTKGEAPTGGNSPIENQLDALIAIAARLSGDLSELRGAVRV